MCGISGAFCFKGSADPSVADRLRKINGALRPRGPDAEGEWSSGDGRVRLAHRRLSILDLSAAGNQPMVDSATGCVLVFNGEIYNFRELRAELEGKGHDFHSTGDSEVLLEGWIEWGEGLLPRLRGMFAFAVWDPRSRSLFLARDPYGIKPLYYGDQSGRFWFASQVRPLRDHAGLDPAPNPAGVVGFLLTGSVPEPHTCHRGIRALPAGHWLLVGADGLGRP